MTEAASLGGKRLAPVSAAEAQDMKKHPVDSARVRARTLRQNMTEAEQRVWQILRSHRMNGYKFRRQAPITRYIADFVCHETRLIVEIDGGQHDRSSPTEAARTKFLQNEGYRLLRFWNNEVLANFDGVQQMIADELGRVTPTRPSPIKGGFAGEIKAYQYIDLNGIGQPTTALWLNTDRAAVQRLRDQQIAAEYTALEKQTLIPAYPIFDQWLQIGQKYQ